MKMILDFNNEINNKSEVTSSISTISYSIENALYENVENKTIYENILEGRRRNNFPKNLTFIDAHLDEAIGMSACAFLGEETGKVIVGFTGTNNGTSILHGVNALSVRDANDPYYESTQEFIKKIDKDYTMSTFTGHSKGGHDAEK
ncbi:hypothetical protein KFV05_09065 [Macrococcoides canis]|uniref:hypothetical protein n=1 Tax=Macrococcoides canis TaxID=1855823 RepID=UPI0020B7DA70|nr:hypothetical protein [Macrococcus canis]UTH01860.1 hypothetical protein KFV05_09065 [Macrococcus canis]